MQNLQDVVGNLYVKLLYSVVEVVLTSFNVLLSEIYFTKIYKAIIS